MTVGGFQAFVVLVFQISVVDLTVMLRNFEHISQYDGKRGIDSNSLTRRVVTLCGCGALCGINIDSCKSFFYSKSEGLCSLYTEDLFDLILINASGSKGYSLTGHTQEEVTAPVSTTDTPTSISTTTTKVPETTTSTSPTTTTQETTTSTSPPTTEALETTTSTIPTTTTTPVTTTAAPSNGCDSNSGDDDDDGCDD